MFRFFFIKKKNEFDDRLRYGAFDEYYFQLIRVVLPEKKAVAVYQVELSVLPHALQIPRVDTTRWPLRPIESDNRGRQ